MALSSMPPRCGSCCRQPTFPQATSYTPTNSPVGNENTRALATHHTQTGHTASAISRQTHADPPHHIPSQPSGTPPSRQFFFPASSVVLEEDIMKLQPLRVLHGPKTREIATTMGEYLHRAHTTHYF